LRKVLNKYAEGGGWFEGWVTMREKLLRDDYDKDYAIKFFEAVDKGEVREIGNPLPFLDKIIVVRNSI
jgi:hypothetical protein